MVRLYHPPAGLIWPGLPLLYLLLPGHPLGLLQGLPLDPITLSVLVVLGLAAWCGCRPPASMLALTGYSLAAALALKLTLGALALPYGLAAAYTTSAAPDQPPERSTEWSIDGATRVDRSLQLIGDRFPVHFFNDIRRFNFYTPGQPRRDQLPFAVTWRGWLVEPSDGRRCLGLEANGSAVLRVGQESTASIDRSARVQSREACQEVARGVSPVEVRYARPEGGVPYLIVSEVGANGATHALGPTRLLRQEASYEAIQRDQSRGQVATVLDLLVLTASAVVVLRWLVNLTRARCAATARQGGVESEPWWERPLLGGSLLAALVEGLVAHRHFAGRTAVLSGGNDWLAYESFARDILLHGLLMNSGKPLGEGETLLYQPLYAYFLAALHLLLGESLHGVLVLQYLLVAAAGVLSYFLARELFGRRAGIATLGLFWVFRYLTFNQVASLLLSENLVAVIIPGMLLLLVRWQRSWRWVDLVGGGLLLGLAVLTRSTPLLYLPPAVLLTMLAQRRKLDCWRPALGAAAVLLVVALSVSSLIGLRNLLVAGRASFFVETAGVNLWKAHQPTPAVDLSRNERDPLYRALGVDRLTREVIEFVVQDPVGYAGTLAVMGLYALGVTGPALGTSQIQLELVLLSVTYVAGVLFVPAARSGRAWLLHAFVLTHFLQMMVFFSHQYGFRLPLPMYGPMVVVAGALVAGVTERWQRTARQERGAATAGMRLAGALALGLAAVWTGWQVLLPRDVEADVFGLGGDAAASARAIAAAPETWQADRIYFSGRDQRSFGVAYLPGLAYREMKWLDGARALVWPAGGRRGVLVRSSAESAPLIAACWTSDEQTAAIHSSAAADRLIQWLPDAGSRRCAPTGRRLASFGGFVELLEGTTEPNGQVRVTWRVLQRPSFRSQAVVELQDPTGAVVASAINDPYPAGSWEAGELVVALLARPTVGGDARAAVGFTRGNASDRLSIDDPLALFGQLRLPVGG